ncbi:hypothetical protein [Mucilaginibacter sp.]
MEWPNQEEIPKSNLRSNVSIGIDFGHLKDKGKILFIDPRCFVVGLEDVPYTLFTTPEFSEVNLPLAFKDKIYEVTNLILQPAFDLAKLRKSEHCIILKWLADFKKVEFLRFQRVHLDQLHYLTDLPVKHLVLEDIKLSDSDNLIIYISQFKHLKEISYDESLPLDVKEAIVKLNLK